MTQRPYYFFALIALFVLPVVLPACTIVSAVAENGEVWNMNNEDGPPGVANFINVFPKTEGQRYGYYTLSYLTPAAGEGGNAQGGTNEAGLTFDFNAIRYVADFDPASRQAYPEGNDAILAHIMGNMRSVHEVIAFFETYWFEGGFRSAQMHVADRDGRFALISPSGVQVAEAGQPLISTNFDICGGEDGSSCWRYPIAEEKLATREVNLATMLSIALDTRQKEYTTVYSNVQNLTTGDTWFMSYHDPSELTQVNIKELLGRGRRSYSFRDLASLRGEASPTEQPAAVTGSELPTDSLAGTYYNAYIEDVVVAPHPSGLEVTYSNGVTDVLAARPGGVYMLPEGNEAITFERKEPSGEWLLHLYLDGAWAVTAQRK